MSQSKVATHTCTTQAQTHHLCLHPVHCSLLVPELVLADTGNYLVPLTNEVLLEAGVPEHVVKATGKEESDNSGVGLSSGT